MIDKLHPTFLLGEGYALPPDNYKLMEKINEIIDYLNGQEEKTCKVIWTHQDSSSNPRNMR